MLNQSFFSDINGIGSNIWTGLPDEDRTGLLNENFGLDLDCKNLRFVQHHQEPTASYSTGKL